MKNETTALNPIDRMIDYTDFTIFSLITFQVFIMNDRSCKNINQ